MKLLGIFVMCFAFIILAGIKCSKAQENVQQLDDGYPGLVDGYGIPQDLALNRQKRGTCDFHENFCVAHCRVRGFKRGFCSTKGICNCRD